MKYSVEQMKQALKDGKCFWFYHVSNDQTLYKAKLKGDRISVTWGTNETSYSFLPNPTCLESWICTEIEGEETMTNKPHKHAELIKKWADGAIIQYKGGTSEVWTDCGDNHPYWSRDVNYRVKPNLVKKWKWVYENPEGSMIVTCLHYSSPEEFNNLNPYNKGKILQKVDSTMIEVEE